MANKIADAISSPGGVSAIGGAIGWAAYRLMNPKTITLRRFICGFIFAAFSGWFFSHFLQYLNFPPEHIGAFGAALGSIAEKLRSAIVNRLQKQIQGDSL